MKAIYVSLILSLFTVSASAELPKGKGSINTTCLYRLLNLSSARPRSVSEKFAATVSAAVEKSRQLTREAGIIDRIVSTKLTGPVNGNLYGLNIRVADERDVGQANAYEFFFEVKTGTTLNGQPTIKASLLTLADDWHTHGDYKTVFICEGE